MAPFLLVNVSVINSAGGSIFRNYGTDTFYGNYAGDNVCCIYAGFEVVLSVTGMLADLSVPLIPFPWMIQVISGLQLCMWLLLLQLRSYKLLQHLWKWQPSAANMWVTICIVIMQIGDSVEIIAIMRYDLLSTFVFPICLRKVGTSWIARKGES